MKLLFIDGCVRNREESRTYLLCDSFLTRLTDQHSELEVEVLHLDQMQVTPLTSKELADRDRLSKAGEWNAPVFSYARQFSRADYLLIGAPFWDLTFPAVLKAYLERVCVCGITFEYQGDTCVGLCRAKKMIYISTAGGFLMGEHLGARYVKALGEMLGVQDFCSYCLEGLDIYGIDVRGKLSAALEEIREMADGFISR